MAQGIIPGTVHTKVYFPIRKSEISLFTFSTNPTTKTYPFSNGGTYCNWIFHPGILGVRVKSVEYFQAMSKVLDAFNSEKNPKKTPGEITKQHVFFGIFQKSRVADSENC